MLSGIAKLVRPVRLQHRPAEPFVSNSRAEAMTSPVSSQTQQGAAPCQTQMTV